MQGFTRESFRHIYLLSGTAPEYYGTGHQARSSVIQRALAPSSIQLHPIVSSPEDFWKDQGPGLLEELTVRMTENPGIILLDARDIDPAPFQKVAPVLTLDNLNFKAVEEIRRNLALKPARDFDSEDNMRSARFSFIAKAFPCLYYHLLLPGCDLKTSVRRYLGPMPLNQSPGEDSKAGEVKGTRMTELLFYAGGPGFISEELIHRLDSLFQPLGEAYMRVGGFSPKARIPYLQRMEAHQFADLLANSKMFLGYYGLSLYQAAASGCKVRGLITGHPYHDRLIRSWAQQSGAALLDAWEADSLANWEVDSLADRERGPDWTLQPDALNRGPSCLRAALRALLKAAERGNREKAD